MDASWLNGTICATTSDGVTACGDAILGGTLVQSGIQTSLNEAEQNVLDINAYPNPGTNEIILTVKGEKAGSLYCSVRQISGQLMQTTKMEYNGTGQQFIIPASDYLPGIYLVEVVSERVKKVIRWVKL
jgi:hypothetical protein